MKHILSTLLLTAALLTVNADEVQTLTQGDTTYRATVKNDVVFYNVIGKSAPVRTNLTGWLNLQTNLVTQGFVLTTKKTATYAPAKPYLKEDQISRQDKEFAAEMKREEEARNARITKELVERAGLIGYNMKKREEKIAEGLSHLSK